MKRAHVMISGRVQGVWFRVCTEDKATSVGVKGWVRNLRDGRVEAVFEGDGAAVDAVVAWCWVGSPQSRVTAVDVQWEAPLSVEAPFHIR